MLHWTDSAGRHAIGPGKLKPKTWYHVAGTFGGKALMFYKNGKLASAKDSFIGAHPIPTNFFQGMIDDVAIFDGALSAEEIKKIVERGL